ncbi:MAG: mechanosensitive ion channel protein MscS, partial [Nonlabens ulvanivorans]
IKSELRFAIDKSFRAQNVTIPFPQRDVHIFQSKDKTI